MSFVSSTVAAPASEENEAPSERSAGRGQARQSWWRALWFRRDARLLEIRDAMLGQLAPVVDEDERAALANRISAAQNPQALWSLRQDLMRALTPIHGEMLARRRLTDITFMFAGLLDGQRPAISSVDDTPVSVDWPATAAARHGVHNSSLLRTDH